MQESMRGIIDFLAVTEFSQAILLIFILLVMEKNRKANIFFAAFLFIVSSNFFSFYLLKAGLKYPATVFAVLSIPGLSIAGVFIYFYALFVTGLLEKFRKLHLVHFIPYAVVLAAFSVLLLNTPEFPDRSHNFKRIMSVIISTGLVVSISYIAYTIVLLGRYYKKIENYYSAPERASLNWLKRITSLSVLALTFWCLGFWFAHLRIIPRSHAGMVINIIIWTVIIFITAYYLINQPEVFRKNIEMEQAVEDGEDSALSGKYARQSIDDRMQEQYFEKLSQYMDEHKPFLDENISIKDLAEEVDIPPHHLSIVINNRLNKNFYTFINEYRVREASAILDDPENAGASIIAVAFRSGFNSKSTFNSVFKKMTGYTPSEYRNRGALRSELAS
ncbi:MAG TPA: helix-turn-helix domain-containing protein [Spirochaetota bacterium]|nr:helix-turn-helix domain-containing protein [Spirochaetota bacterium]HPJ35540.1 helix-turn-helix domain-containing protein [Spirochaetota bacterium]